MEPGSSAERTGRGLEVRESVSPVSVLGYSLHTTVLSAQPPAQPRPVMSTPGNVGEGEREDPAVLTVGVKVSVQLQ